MKDGKVFGFETVLTFLNWAARPPPLSIPSVPASAQSKPEQALASPAYKPPLYPTTKPCLPPLHARHIRHKLKTKLETEPLHSRHLELSFLNSWTPALKQPRYIMISLLSHNSRPFICFSNLTRKAGVKQPCLIFSFVCSAQKAALRR